MTDVRFSMHPIGSVKAGSGSFQIVLRNQFKKGLAGLTGFSHILVIWWAHLFAADEYREILEAEALSFGNVVLNVILNPVHPGSVFVLKKSIHFSSSSED